MTVAPITAANYKTRLQAATAAMTARGIAFDTAAAQDLRQAIEAGHRPRDNMSPAAVKQWVGRLNGFQKLTFMDGRIYPEWTAEAQASGRWSSGNPSLQNVAQELRYLFPNLGSFDLSQIELVVAFWLAGDTRAIERYIAGEDFHTQLANDLNITRELAKEFNSGTMYGLGAPSIAAKSGCSTSQAYRYLDALWDSRPLVRELKDRIGQQAIQTGIIETAILGHKRVLEIDQLSDWAAINQGFATYISGTAADIAKIIMIGLHETGHEIVATVHDAFVKQAGLFTDADIQGALALTPTPWLRYKTKAGW